MIRVFVAKSKFFRLRDSSESARKILPSDDFKSFLTGQYDSYYMSHLERRRFDEMFNTTCS